MYRLVKIKVDNPNLNEIFQGEKKVYPKPLRITSLLKDNNEAVYPKRIVTNFSVDSKPKEPPKPITIRGAYWFYVGYETSLEPEISKAIASIFSGFNMRYGEFDLKIKAVELSQESFDDFPTEFSQVRVKLITPSLFKDPFEKLASVDRIKTRRYLPFPPFIFSTNVFEIFRETYKRNIIRLSYGLLESHNNLNTATKVWYYYDGKWLPGVIGYLKFFVRKGLKKEVISAFREVFIHANLMGVGTGRAAGFGFAQITAR
ncbi:CRISPR-associated protein Cas6 [Sulfolobus sp. F3]|nr:CRISPR-associated protein Cas6 [Sulfolobus sp. F3]